MIKGFLVLSGPEENIRAFVRYYHPGIELREVLFDLGTKKAYIVWEAMTEAAKLQFLRRILERFQELTIEAAPEVTDLSEEFLPRMPAGMDY